MGLIPAELIPLERLAGLSPATWLAVGPGFAREEIKALLLESGSAFVADAVTTAPEIARKVLNASGRSIGSEAVLESLGRQEVLRLLLGERRLSARFPELKKLRRQGGFFRRLDRALQAGRLAISHAEEEEAILGRLEQRFGKSSLREELSLLARAYEAWLMGSELWDPPLLLRQATEALAREWPARLQQPGEILHFTIQQPESLERTFWDALSRTVPVRRPEWGTPAGPGVREVRWSWERWHTLDDAAERLAECLAAERDLTGHAVLLADSPSVRRSLKRALRDWGVTEADPRDPLRLQQEEAVKWALLPLELVGRGYEREQVVAWIRGFLSDPEARREGPGWVAETSARGLRLGRRGYQGGALTPVFTRLERLEATLGGRKSCDELAKAHLALLRENLDERGEAAAALGWALGFFEELWARFGRELEILGLRDRRAPPLYWLERIVARVQESPAPVERARPSGGLAVYRLQQAPLRGARKLWVFGLSGRWLSAEGVGDYFFSEREREVLSAEFAVRSGIQARAERLSALRAWLAGAQEIALLDALHDPDGGERELLTPVLKEWGGPHTPSEPLDKGAHPRWSASYGALRPLQPQEARLPALPARPGASCPEITATALDRYSRCAFQALAFDRWKLRDSREPDCDLWPDARGNILHEAVRLLIEGRDDAGGFSLSPAEALDRAWRRKPPKGLLRSASLERHLRSRLVQVLESFCEKEREYQRRAGARPRLLDDTSLRLELGEVAIKGTPDRIDEISEGLFVMDYKTSGGLPSGADMVELGYRLQLPFYALAAEERLGRPVLGVQFIELSRKGSRSSGIFFKRHNGKEPGKLTQVRSNSRSLLPGEPGELWPVLRERIAAEAKGFARGEFAARPKRGDRECQGCVAGDLCGYRRRISDGLTDEASEKAEGGAE
ncbi:MAG: PD-(D/E)XK nuclease family protein [Oligoflexia bacterium]|nr:PD-(D/E)XK nuclease family protein [Oligoflexia bacterium]